MITIKRRVKIVLLWFKILVLELPKMHVKNCNKNKQVSGFKENKKWLIKNPKYTCGKK